MADDDFRVLDAAEKAVVMLNDLIDRSPRRLLHVTQMRSSAEGIPGNIAEGLGRKDPVDRTYKYVVARGEAKETLSRLRTNFKSGRIAPKDYWAIRNLLATVVKMLSALIFE
jgi:four helix bundle protein